MTRRRLGRVLVFLAFLACGRAGAEDIDALKRLETDPSPDAGKRLVELYQKTKSRDQRFWLIQTLGARLKELGDPSALRQLLAAAKDPDPGLRVVALRGLTGFAALPEKDLRSDWLVSLDSAAAKGSEDKVAAVRTGAGELSRALSDWRRSPQQILPAAEPPPGRGLASRLMTVLLWIVGVPLVVLTGLRLGRGLRGAEPEEAKKAVRTDGAPQAVGPYSQAVRSGEWVFISGQIGLDPVTGKLVEGGVKEQTRRALDNIEAILAAEGLGLASVVKTTVYLTDISQWPDMNSVYAERIPAPFPARAAVEVGALPKEALVEIEAVARAA